MTQEAGLNLFRCKKGDRQMRHDGIIRMALGGLTVVAWMVASATQLPAWGAEGASGEESFPPLPPIVQNVDRQKIEAEFLAKAEQGAEQYRKADVVLAAGLVCTAGSAADDNRDKEAGESSLEVLKGRVVNILTRDASIPDPEKIRDLRQRLQSDGSWPDINYNSRQPGGWPAAREHIGERLWPMVLAWRLGQSPLKEDASLLADIGKASDYWLKRNLGNPGWAPNWWYTEIYIPQMFGRIGLLIGDAMNEETSSRLETLCSRARASGTGQNFVWRSEATLYHGLLTDNADKVQNQVNNIFSQLKVVDNEGVQYDWSFHQHGRQQQMGNYGLHYAETIAPWLYAVTGTNFEPPREKIALFRKYLLKGQAWYIQPGIYDINGAGRSFMRIERGFEGLEGSFDKVVRAFEYLSEADPEAVEACRETLRLIESPDDKPRQPLGNRWYPYSACMVHRRPGWSVSLKMVSAGLTANEGINDEGVLGGLIGFGSLFQYTQPDDYHGVLEVWNWRRIPGTTAGLNKGSIGAGKAANASRLVFGVSNSGIGGGAMEMRPDKNAQPIAWRKSWFFFDDSYVALGRILSSQLDDEIVTTVAQERLDAAPQVLQADATAPAHSETITLATAGAVVHGQTAYLFPAAATLQLHAGPMTGNWYRSYPQPEQTQYKEEHTRDIFSLALSHGNAAADAPAIQYFVFPEDGRDQAKAFLSEPWVDVIANNARIQGVYNKKSKVLQVVFFEPDAIEVNGRTIKVNAPAMIMLKELSDGLELTVCGVSGTQPVTLSINGHYQSNDTSCVSDNAQTHIRIEGFPIRDAPTFKLVPNRDAPDE